MVTFARWLAQRRPAVALLKLDRAGGAGRGGRRGDAGQPSKWATIKVLLIQVLLIQVIPEVGRRGVRAGRRQQAVVRRLPGPETAV